MFCYYLVVKDKLLHHQYQVSDIEIKQREVVYEGFFAMQKLSYRYPKFAGGSSSWLHHEVMVRPPAVVVLPIDIKERKVVLIEQVRSGIVAVSGRQPWLYEVVAGLLEAKDSPVSGAERELEEETGLQALAWEKIAQYWVSPGGSTEEVYAYCALVDSREAGGIHGLATENEDIRVQTFAMDDILDALQRGEINNSATLLCLQWLQLNKAKLTSMWSSI